MRAASTDTAVPAGELPCPEKRVVNGFDCERHWLEGAVEQMGLMLEYGQYPDALAMGRVADAATDAEWAELSAQRGPALDALLADAQAGLHFLDRDGPIGALLERWKAAVARCRTTPRQEPEAAARWLVRLVDQEQTWRRDFHDREADAVATRLLRSTSAAAWRASGLLDRSIAGLPLLHYAIRHWSAAVSLLLQAGADPCATDADGRTALEAFRAAYPGEEAPDALVRGDEAVRLARTLPNGTARRPGARM